MPCLIWIEDLDYLEIRIKQPVVANRVNGVEKQIFQRLPFDLPHPGSVVWTRRSTNSSNVVSSEVTQELSLEAFVGDVVFHSSAADQSVDGEFGGVVEPFPEQPAPPDHGRGGSGLLSTATSNQPPPCRSTREEVAPVGVEKDDIGDFWNRVVVKVGVEDCQGTFMVTSNIFLLALFIGDTI